MNECDNGPEIHYCPQNFRHLQSLPGEAVLDMETVNSALATINSLFIENFFTESAKPATERLPIAEFLSGRAEKWFTDKIVDKI
jgi:hypothetical protein